MKRGVQLKRFLLCFLPTSAAALFLLTGAHAGTHREERCSCSDGRVFEPGVVSYSGNSDRETVTRIEVAGGGPDHTCTAIWIAGTEVQPKGTPYYFYLQRRSLRERRFDGCDDSTNRFLKRSKKYKFAYHSDSVSIREMAPASPVETNNNGVDPRSRSNDNLWNSISVNTPEQESDSKTPAAAAAPNQEFCRTAWVLARKDLMGHYVGIEKEIGGAEHLVKLKGTQKVKAGQLGQVEASTISSAIVRFYRGSRIQSFATARNKLLRWYDNVGGPYREATDDLYTSLRAYIVEVSLADIVEVNDYMDQKKTDRT